MNQTAKLRCGQLVGDIMQIMHTKYFDSNLLFWPQIAWLLVHAAIDPIPQCINCYQIKQLLIEKAYYPNSRVRKYYVKSKPNSYFQIIILLSRFAFPLNRNMCHISSRSTLIYLEPLRSKSQWKFKWKGYVQYRIQVHWKSCWTLYIVLSTL
ncbi:Hypothetical_protein [Hexamita inflata]|uniref:Hypothetical_protein n=1 Tax=Hexamita inflata TaxID=28002 RepID=A0AA86NAB0_9EUKA|nr:Hypothetical protein HINF_LOCUS3607 [Hexamita inflata]